VLPLVEPRQPRGERYLSSGVRPRKYASAQDAPGSTVFTAPPSREIVAQIAADPDPARGIEAARDLPLPLRLICPHPLCDGLNRNSKASPGCTPAQDEPDQFTNCAHKRQLRDAPSRAGSVAKLMEK